MSGITKLNDMNGLAGSPLRDWQAVTTENGVSSAYGRTTTIPQTDALLNERDKTHGDYTDVADVAQGLKAVMRESGNWDGLTEIQKESLELIASKIGRI